MNGLDNDCLCEDMTGLFEVIKNVRQVMEASSVADDAKMKLTTVWNTLKRSYHLDVKVNNTLPTHTFVVVDRRLRIFYAYRPGGEN